MRSWNELPSVIGIWTARSPPTGLPWIGKHGSDSTAENQLPGARRDLSHRARPDARPEIVAPITSTVRFPLNPVHVLLAADQNTGLSVTSVAVFNQIGAVDRIQLIRRLGEAGEETMERADTAIQISLGLVRLV